MKDKSWRRIAKYNIYGGKMADTPFCINKHVFCL